MGPTWGPPGSCRPQIGPMLAPWTLLSGGIHYDARVWKPFHQYIPLTKDRLVWDAMTLMCRHCNRLCGKKAGPCLNKRFCLHALSQSWEMCGQMNSVRQELISVQMLRTTVCGERRRCLKWLAVCPVESVDSRWEPIFLYCGCWWHGLPRQQKEDAVLPVLIQVILLFWSIPHSVNNP